MCFTISVKISHIHLVLHYQLRYLTYTLFYNISEDISHVFYNMNIEDISHIFNFTISVKISHIHFILQYQLIRYLTYTLFYNIGEDISHTFNFTISVKISHIHLVLQYQ